MNYTWTMFMAHLPHSDIDYIIETLKEYNIRQYIIGLEESEYQHYHFIVEFETGGKDYTNFASRVFIKKYKLRGQAKKGLARQYGKVGTIENIEKAKAYTVKDNNIHTNMNQQEIDAYLDISFKKEDIKAFKKKVFIYIEEKLESGILPYEPPAKYNDYGQVCCNPPIDEKTKDLIVAYHIENEVEISKSKFYMLYNYWLRNTKHLILQDKISQIRKFNFF